MCVFFFQAEDGIRDVAVTGVQTCALPISRLLERAADDLAVVLVVQRLEHEHATAREQRGRQLEARVLGRGADQRSEERRVGKRVDLGGRRIIKKKKKRKI